MKMKGRGRAGLAAIVVMAATGVGWWSWQRSAPRRTAVAGVSAIGDLSRWPAAFREHLTATMAEVTGGAKPVEALGRLALLYLANDFTTEAEKALTTLCVVQPTEARWPYYRATALARRGQTRGAERLFKEALALAPEYSPAAFQLGQLLAGAGRDAEARVYYQQRLEQEPADVLATMGLVDIARRGGDQPAAIRHLQAVLRLRPEATEARLLLAEILDSTGRGDEAAEQRRMMTATAAATPVDDPWMDELYQHSFDPFRLQTLGMVQLQAGRAAKAVPFLRKAAELSPDDADLQDSLAQALQATGRTDDAREVLQRALARKPGAAGLHVRLADLLATTGNVEEAEARLRQAIATQPSRAELQDALGRLLSRTGRTEEAIAAFTEALRLSPVLTGTQLSLGRALRAAGRSEEAASTIRKALEMRPEWQDAILLLGALEAESRRWGEADAWARRALAGNPGSASARSFFAQVALARGGEAVSAGRLVDAETIYREAVTIVPTHGPLYGALGALLGKQRRLEEARVAFQTYTEHAPDDARAWLLLGSAWEQLGQKQQALTAFTRARDVARASGDDARLPLIEQALRRVGA